MAAAGQRAHGRIAVGLEADRAAAAGQRRPRRRSRPAPRRPCGGCWRWDRGRGARIRAAVTWSRLPASSVRPAGGADGVGRFHTHRLVGVGQQRGGRHGIQRAAQLAQRLQRAARTGASLAAQRRHQRGRGRRLADAAERRAMAARASTSNTGLCRAAPSGSIAFRWRMLPSTSAALRASRLNRAGPAGRPSARTGRSAAPGGPATRPATWRTRSSW